MFSIIAAVGKNFEIGFDNRLIWRIPEDLKFFRETTTNHKILMGRKTFESLPNVLPNRENIIVTTQNIEIPGARCINDLDEFIKENENTREEIFVIGGGSIYEKLLPNSSRIYLTEVFGECLVADTYFPKFDREVYLCERIFAGDHNGLKYERNLYIKK